MPQLLDNPQYLSFTAKRYHFHKNGLAMMPTAGLFPKAAQVVALHGGIDFDIIAYIAVRRGEPPVVLAPQTTNKNRVFLEGERIGLWPINEIDGVSTYEVSGWLLFGILSPEGLASDFMLGDMPWAFPGVPVNEQIPKVYFSYSLINQTMIQPLGVLPPMPPLIQGIANQG